MPFSNGASLAFLRTVPQGEVHHCEFQLTPSCISIDVTADFDVQTGGALEGFREAARMDGPVST